MSWADDHPLLFKKFFDAYITCALCTSTDPDTGKNYEGRTVAPESLEALKEDCSDFIEANYLLIRGQLALAGQDFWLTRNRHGSGFWDGHWNEHGQLLTDRSRVYGSVDAYAGDDGLIYFT